MRFLDLFTRVKSMDTEQVKQMVEKGPLGSYFVVDVREPEEYEQGHIPGALLIPLSQLPARMGEIDRTKPVVAY